MKQIISHQTFDEERALYGLQDAAVEDCTFAGPADGESALKETRGVEVKNCAFSLRYPLWHGEHCAMTGCTLDEGTRAPVWYTRDSSFADCRVEGVKFLRECDRCRLERCEIRSPEFGWKCRSLQLTDCEIHSEYCLFDSSDVNITNLRMTGKYSFQYMKNLHIKDSVLDTKDAFWHSENVLVENSVVKGEYLGWFSKGLTLINCRIIGTQPLCYCEELRLVNCTMEDTDLAFEYSSVEADVRGHIVSVKNPKSGTIVADSVGEIIREGSVMETEGKVVLRG